MTYTYPYIPKEYYPAVMYACQVIREYGYFNKAIESAARYYKVDKDELKKHVVARQQAGRKAKAKSGYTMKKFRVILATATDADPEPYYTEEIVRGKSKETVQKRFAKENLEYTMANDYGGNYAPYRLIHSIEEIEE